MPYSVQKALSLTDTTSTYISILSKKSISRFAKLGTLAIDALDDTVPY
jgi:hypothetical protein